MHHKELEGFIAAVKGSEEYALITSHISSHEKNMLDTIIRQAYWKGIEVEVNSILNA